MRICFASLPNTCHRSSTSVPQLCIGMDSENGDSRSQELVRQQELQCPANQRHDEFPQPVLLWQVLQGGHRHDTEEIPDAITMLTFRGACCFLVGLKIVFLLDQSATGHTGKPNWQFPISYCMLFSNILDVQEKETTKES